MNEERYDEKLPKRLNGAARDYNDPPETPREAIWAAIEARRDRQRYSDKLVKPRFWRSPRIWLPAAAAAALVIGIAIGRMTLPADTPDFETATGPRDQPIDILDQSPESESVRKAITPNQAIYQAAAVPVLSAAELLLTEIRVGNDPDGNGASFPSRASRLLADTRLLLDSPAAENIELRYLLQDLELILAQIVRMSSNGHKEDMDWVNESLRNRALLPRLRSQVPAGKVATTM